MEEQLTPPKPGVFLFLTGIVLPAISITVEATTHICAQIFFDPLPSVWHLLAVIFVPLAQLHTWLTIRRGTGKGLKIAGFTNAIVIGISIFYTILYIPVLPLAALTIFIGLGFLPLAPYSSLLAAIIMRWQLAKVPREASENTFAIRKSGLVVGLASVIVFLALIELPATLTRIGLQKATAASPETRAEGIRFLRTYGTKDALLRQCYNQTGETTDLFGFLFSINNPIDATEVQKIYYRVTGETFDSSIPPERVGGRLVPMEMFDFDDDQGGTKIAGKLRGLSLKNSKIDGTVDPEGGVGYLQWTLVFQNDSGVQREARAEVQLPPGAVVSRLTLWVNGEEREAAFAGRGKVTQAYRQVVVRERRDPVLVTTAGRDRILVQCFPVPPNGGEMKIRIGVTVPLVLEDLTRAQLLLPHFENRNFRIPDDVHHSLWIESTTNMLPFDSSIRSERTQSGFVLAGSTTDQQLSQPTSAILANRSSIKDMWSKDPFEADNIVRQAIEERTPLHLRRIVIVVDTSVGMRNLIEPIKTAIAFLPHDFDVKLVLTNTDAPAEAGNVLAAGRDEIAGALSYARPAGGADNAPALLKAWDVAAETPGNNAIVWIHAPQRMLLQSVDQLRERWEKRPYGPLLYSIRTANGADEIEKKLEGIDEVKSVWRSGELDEDLKRLFARLTGRVKTFEYVRTNRKLDPQSDLSRAVKTHDHLARLWANDEVARILAPRDPALETAAITLAVSLPTRDAGIRRGGARDGRAVQSERPHSS